MLLSVCFYYPHHGSAGIARRGLRPDSARAWPDPVISLFFLFRAFFSTPATAPRGLLRGRITLFIDEFMNKTNWNLRAIYWCGSLLSHKLEIKKA